VREHEIGTVAMEERQHGLAGMGLGVRALEQHRAARDELELDARRPAAVDLPSQVPWSEHSRSEASWAGERSTSSMRSQRRERAGKRAGRSS
jgi:hypothetical protein